MATDGECNGSTEADEFVIRVVPSFSQFTEAEWRMLAGTCRDDEKTPYNPFISHGFLSSLEEAGCAVRETGWQPQHLRLEGPGGVLLGAVPCFLKSHSQGEYVFDHGWADAFERAGGAYYPKLQVSVPFTPATGPRLLARRGGDPAPARGALAAGLTTLAERLGVSSAHVTFAPEPEVDALQQAGFLHRTDQQFHFRNQDYGSFDDFLSSLASRKRKAIRKERRDALGEAITIEWLSGRDLTEAVWDDFYRFYIDTGGRKWGRPYLTRRFFSLIGERMGNDILLVMARRGGRHIAGAINFIGGDTLFGRHWGCVEDHPFLHFEVCYYQAIAFAIERGLKVVEAGAQGPHKLARGYVPVTTHSAHFIAHPGLRRAVADYLDHERADVARVGAYFEDHAPFRKP
ncbi:GNAT family N-acetyltransferase [Nitratireductor sp. CAU 1489]|uniref:GNAT family N-acetyltransferase n=1 Tax=Nitratireductor arenosus TaxID=2682096 RepID=A0A844QIV2_9HYPH|nr:GNAT family N-acetyltransferase [Nitratireductor arenosus]